MEVERVIAGVVVGFATVPENPFAVVTDAEVTVPVPALIVVHVGTAPVPALAVPRIPI